MRASSVGTDAVPNWTAWRFKFRRSRRMKLVAGILLLLVVWFANQMIAAALRPDPPAAAAPSDNETVPGGQVEVLPTAPVWRVGDYWVWEDGHGLRITDRVAGTSRDRAGILLYHVERESSMSDGRKPRVENVVYDSRVLAVRSVSYGDQMTVDWQQRTLGLLDASPGVGFQANATVERSGGENGRLLRVANITGVTDAYYRAPAGMFATRLVQGRFLDYDLRDPDRSQVIPFVHWWSGDVANDVAFTLPNSTPEEPRVMRLVGYRSVGGHLTPPPRDDARPAWREGFTWTWEAQDQARRVVRVVEAERGFITVERRETGGPYESLDTTTYRASDLAPVAYTLGGAPFRISPHGVPLRPPDGDTVLAYTKSVETAWGVREFEGNATVSVRPDVRVETRMGPFDAVRVDVTEKEYGDDGQPIPEMRSVRYYAPEVGNDARVVEGGRIWDLVSYSFGIPPWRWDSLPPP